MPCAWGSEGGAVEEGGQIGDSEAIVRKSTAVIKSFWWAWKECVTDPNGNLQ